MKKPLDEQAARAAMKEFVRDVEGEVRANMVPKMKQSVFVMIGMHGATEDLMLALQIGLALLLDKPLIIVATGNAWIPPRLRQLAEAVIQGPEMDDGLRTRLRGAIGELLRKQGHIQ